MKERNERIDSLSLLDLVEELSTTDEEIEVLRQYKHHDEDTLGYLNALYRLRGMILDRLDRQGQQGFLERYGEFGRVI